MCVETHVQVCSSGTAITSDSIVSKKLTYKKVNLILFGESNNLYKLPRNECFDCA